MGGRKNTNSSARRGGRKYISSKKKKIVQLSKREEIRGQGTQKGGLKREIRFNKSYLAAERAPFSKGSPLTMEKKRYTKKDRRRTSATEKKEAFFSD